MHVLGTRYSNWRELCIHESNPSGPMSEKLARECRLYQPSAYFPNLNSGEMHNGIRCEDLERQSFPAAMFDLVITSDVLEHLLDPAAACREIARTLKPGGAHVFTVPWVWWKQTLVRARRLTDGTIEHLEPADYHGNPFDAGGSLVVREWGWDLCDFIYAVAGMTTTAILVEDMRLGLAGQFNEVFVSVNRIQSEPSDL